MADETAGSAAKLEELKDKYQKDPASRIFLQLAEEYRKLGRFEEAVQVCVAGLQKHPTYTSARVTLARAYTGAKRYDEAKAEFEKVIAAVPDNLLANRCLGDLYYEEGRSDEARRRYQVVQMLNPGDEEVAARLGGSRPAGPVRRRRPRMPYLLRFPRRWRRRRRRLPRARPRLPPLRPRRKTSSRPSPTFVSTSPSSSTRTWSRRRSGEMRRSRPGGCRRSARSANGSRAPTQTKAEPAMPEDELGMGAEDFSDFSSPTVMLNVKDLAKMAGIAEAEELHRHRPRPRRRSWRRRREPSGHVRRAYGAEVRHRPLRAGAGQAGRCGVVPRTPAAPAAPPVEEPGEELGRWTTSRISPRRRS